MERNKFSKRKRRAGIGRRFLTGVALLGVAGVTAIGCSGEGDEGVGSSVQALAVDCALDAPELCDGGVGLSLTLEGCRISDAPDGFDLEANNFRCDGAIQDIYTTGNILAGFNELDLVPHRLTIGTTGAFEPDPQTYIVSIGHDSILEKPAGQFQGYDAITVPTLRSTDGCTIEEVGDERVEDVGVGGVDQTIFRDLVITQAAGAECVLDWQARLAVSRDPFLGASAFTGSSLQSQVVTGSGSKTVPIPVTAIEPQAIDKDMTAEQNVDFMWNITKGPQDAMLKFGDTCDPNNDLEETVEIQVNWEILQGMPGMVMIVTNIYATNPANRSITVTVSDEIFSGTTLLGVEDCEPVVVPANTTQLVCTHMVDAPDDVTDLSDTATATYTDLVTGIPVPGQSQAMASAEIQPGGMDTNTTATITDTEWIEGVGLEYALDFSSSVLPPGDCTVGGSPYLPDMDTGIGPFLGPADPDLVCVTDENVITETGFGTLSKIVTLDEPRIISDGELSDKAELLGSDGFEAEASLSIAISSTAKIDLVIYKELGFTVTNATTWTFDVEGSQGNLVADDVTITIPGGSSSGSVTVNDLDPDTYTVTETPVNGWVPTANPKMVTLALPECEGSVTFTNNPGDNFFAQVEVQKMTDPTGNEAGWDFNLTGTAGGESASVTTTGANFIRFDLDGGTNPGADAGSYSMAEVPQAGWDLQADIVYSVVNCWDTDQNVTPTVVETCDFNVQYERDVGCVFRCTYENVQRGKIIVEKQTDPAGSPQEFEFQGKPAGFIADNGQLMVDNLVPGTYTSTEIVPATWDLTDITCDDGVSTNPSSGDLDTATATFELDPGETVTCVFTNVERGMADVLKTVSGGPPNGEVFDFEIRKGADASNVGEVIAEAYHFEDDPVITRTQVAGTDPVTGAAGFRCVSTEPAECVNLVVDDFGTTPTPTLDDEVMAKLPPGDYQFCEANVMPGWMSDIKDWADAFPLPMISGLFFVPNQNDPLVDNSVYCAPFTLAAGQTVNFQVDNTPPPGGDARTIGFWKNWTSCDGAGNQDPVLDETLALSLITCPDGGPGIWIGKVCVDTCYEAVSLLDKREIAEDLRGKKRASDACYNAASQLLASELNELAGARTCTDLAGLQYNTQTILFSNYFDGAGKCVKGGPTGQALNDNAGDLDDYNNNEPGAVCN